MHRSEEAEALESRAAAVAATNTGMFAPSAGLSSPGGAGRTVPAANVPKLISNIGQSIAAKVPNADKISATEAAKLVSEHPEEKDNWLLLIQKHVDAKDWSSAANTIDSFIRQFPEGAKKMRRLLAICHYQAGNHQSAIEQMRLAINAEPNEGDHYLTLYEITLASGDSKGALEIEGEFVEKFPSHPKHEEISQHYEYAKQDQEVQEQKAAFKNKPLPAERSQSFPLNAMPLKVFIHNRYDSNTKFEPHPQVSDDNPAEFIQRACDTWASASGNKVSFLLTDRPEESSIEVFLTEDPNGLEQGYAQGITEHAQRGENKKRIRLLTIDRESGKPLNKGEFLDACLHEMGHALGLLHSGNISDIMYQAVHDKPLCGLSNNDCERVTLLYTSGIN
jgi:tetratricopeptide (TPR) repeat protein